jgi:ribosomal protein S15P/S13E
MLIRLSLLLETTTLPSDDLKVLIRLVNNHVVRHPEDTNAMVNLRLMEEDYHGRITEIIDVTQLDKK